MPQNVLLIQSESPDAAAIRDALNSWGRFEVEWLERCTDGVKRLENVGGGQKQAGPAAIMLDLDLVDSQGIETFDRIYDVAPQIPILVLSADRDEAIAIVAVQRGAQDYLLKPRVNDYLLLKALTNMLERAAISEALFEEKERAQVTLNSIGDGVISTDSKGSVTYLNLVAERMTGWSRKEAIGHPFYEVFRTTDTSTDGPLPDPMLLAIRRNKPVGLSPNCMLIRRDGHAAAVEDSVAPIHDRRGAVTGAVMVFHDVSVARALSFRMSHLAQHDSLTDLPNRVLFDDRLTQAMAMARRLGQHLAVLFLDLDRFKHVNDSLGHAVGDRLLRSVAQRLLGCVRSSDTVSRQGGDEFVILLPGLTQPVQATITAEKVLVALRAVHRIDQHELYISASLGVVTYPGDGSTSETLMKHADCAMYQAKENGRDNFQFFVPEMNARASERQSVELGLRLALVKKEFQLNYQPKINLETGAIMGAEALIRWRHPERGLLGPIHFIAVAEDSGLIVPIGRWVLREACRQARAWQDAGLPRLRMAINISAVELRSKGFVAGVRTALAETGIQADCLELELTETFLMQDSKSTADVLHALRNIGVHLALDDFGTGYSSLSYLKRFPIDTLKIDQSFVRDLTTDASDASIVSAVISMGKSLNMRVVAEGIETTEQLDYLRRKICPEGQGYYFSRPVGAGEFAQLLQAP